jgi:multidrug efflux pump subunit AcrB
VFAVAPLALIGVVMALLQAERWGPMAYAMMGGIIVKIMPTLLFLPALYVAWFSIEGPVSVSTGPDAAST